MFWCEIAELFVAVPEAGGLAPRCREYVVDKDVRADVTIRPELYRKENYPETMSEENLAYMEAAYQFYMELLNYGGMYLHASAVEYQGKVYLFSGPCGMGKSTHTKLWQKVFGQEAMVINDDKPALRRLENKWYAYGTPWCGKDGINMNRKAPLGGICFLQQDSVNEIRRLTAKEAMQKIFSQTIYKFKEIQRLDLMLDLVDKLVSEIPVFELRNKPEPEAARLSYETMSKAAEEIGL